MIRKFGWVFFVVAFVLKLIIYYFLDETILPSIPFIRIVLLELGIIACFLPLYIIAFPISMKIKLMPGFTLVLISVAQFTLTGIWMAILGKYELISYSPKVTIIFAISYFIYTVMQIIFFDQRVKEERLNQRRN